MNATEITVFAVSILFFLNPGIVQHAHRIYVAPLVLPCRIDEQEVVGMSVNIYEAGHDAIFLCLDHAPARHIRAAGANTCDLVSLDADRAPVYRRRYPIS